MNVNDCLISFACSCFMIPVFSKSKQRCSFLQSDLKPAKKLMVYFPKALSFSSLLFQSFVYLYISHLNSFFLKEKERVFVNSNLAWNSVTQQQDSNAFVILAWVSVSSSSACPLLGAASLGGFLKQTKSYAWKLFLDFLLPWCVWLWFGLGCVATDNNWVSRDVAFNKGWWPGRFCSPFSDSVLTWLPSLQTVLPISEQLKLCSFRAVGGCY